MSKKQPSVLGIRLDGVTPLLINKDDILYLHPELVKTKDESYIEHEERIWRDKAHVNGKDEIIFPDTWIRKMLIASQASAAYPIKPPGARGARATMKPYFTSGILVDNSVISNGKPITKKRLVAFPKMVSPQGKGKVLCIRPMVQLPWEVKIEITVTVDMIRPEHIVESLAWAGKYNGAGDWRPQKGGMYGTFNVTYNGKQVIV